jgi:ankyrin repeat protein
MHVSSCYDIYSILKGQYGKAHNIDLLWPKEVQSKKNNDDDAEGDDDIPKIKSLVSLEKLVERKDKIKGQTAAHLAALHGHLDVIKALVSRNEKVPFILNKNRETCLISACKAGHLDIVKYLVKICGKKLVGKVDKTKKSPLMHAVKNGMIIFIILSLLGHFEIAKYLIENESSPNHHDSSDNYVIHYAAAYGWLDCVKLLVAAGADIGVSNAWKTSALTLALQKCHTEVVDFILNHTQDVNVRDGDGNTMLHQLLANKTHENIELVKLLVEKKNADINVYDTEGQGLMHLLADNPHDDDVKMAELLVSKGLSDVSTADKSEKKMTPLMIALECDNTPMIEFLLSQNSIKLDSENGKPNILHMLIKKLNNIDIHKVTIIYYIRTNITSCSISFTTRNLTH